MRARLEDFAGKADGIANPLEGGCRTGSERRTIHDNGVAFDTAIQIEVRSVARIEERIIFEDDDSRFDGVERRTPTREDGPSGG